MTVRDRGYPPSVREIAVAVDLASTSAVHHHLQALEREGLLERGASHSRAIRLTPLATTRTSGSEPSGTNVIPFEGRTLPVIGEIAAAVQSRHTRRRARPSPFLTLSQPMATLTFCGSAATR